MISPLECQQRCLVADVCDYFSYVYTTHTVTEDCTAVPGAGESAGDTTCTPIAGAGGTGSCAVATGTGSCTYVAGSSTAHHTCAMKPRYTEARCVEQPYVPARSLSNPTDDAFESGAGIACSCPASCYAGQYTHGVAPGQPTICVKMMNFVSKTRNCVLKMMDFALQMMNSVGRLPPWFVPECDWPRLLLRLRAWTVSKQYIGYDL